MLGAIIGDMCGSTYEFANEKDISKVEMFRAGSRPTDDSVMTVAVARALMDTQGMSDRRIKRALINSMHYYGGLFPHAGYGGRFRDWLRNYRRKPYNSWGNGSAMRVSAAGWLHDTIEETLHAAKLTAEVTHNHHDGIAGAEAIAGCIWLARNGYTKDDIKEYIEDTYDDLAFKLDEIRPYYDFSESCRDSCPQAIEAFLESEDFVDAVKKAISIGGDSDTIAAMTGSIAEAYYGIPEDVKKQAMEILEKDSALADEVKRFYNIKKSNIT